MANASTTVGAKGGLGCKGLSLREAGQQREDWTSGRKGCNGLQVAVGEGGLGSAPLMAHPTVRGGVQMLVMTSPLRVWGVQIRELQIALQLASYSG